MNAIRNAISELWDTSWFKISFGLVALGTTPVIVMSLIMQALHSSTEGS